jgi:hypothetical protein
MKDYLDVSSKIAVSANTRQTGMGTPATLDTSILCDKQNVAQLEPLRESNESEMTGYVGATEVRDKGFSSKIDLSFPMARAGDLSFIYVYILGMSTPSAWGGGHTHLHEYVPTDPPMFTLADMQGEITKRRFYAMAGDTAKVSYKVGSWVNASMGCKGTGQYDKNLTSEIVTAAYNASALTLAANAVHGSTAALRLDNVHEIKVTVPNLGYKQQVSYTAVSGATPAVITITAPAPTASAITGLSQAVACVVTWADHGLQTGDSVAISGITQADWIALNATHEITRIGDGSFSIPVDTSGYGTPYAPETDPGVIRNATDAVYEILYVSTEAAWCDFPIEVTEPPLRCVNMTINIGGTWNGTEFLGGRDITDAVNSLDHDISRGLIVEQRMGSNGQYANYMRWDKFEHTIALTKQMRDYCLQVQMEGNETVGLQVRCEGVEFESGKVFYAETIFPLCGILGSPISKDGHVIVEAGNLKVLEGGAYPPIICRTANLISGYAQ